MKTILIEKFATNYHIFFFSGNVFQVAFSRLTSTMETSEQHVKSVQS